MEKDPSLKTSNFAIITIMMLEDLLIMSFRHEIPQLSYKVENQALRIMSIIKARRDYDKSI